MKIIIFSIITGFVFAQTSFSEIIIYSKNNGKIKGHVPSGSIVHYDSSKESVLNVDDLDPCIKKGSDFKIENGKVVKRSNKEIDAIKKEKDFDDNFTRYEALEKEIVILDSIISGTTIQKIIDRASVKKAKNTVKIKEVNDKMISNSLEVIE